jgi:hypothetical protein
MRGQGKYHFSLDNMAEIRCMMFTTHECGAVSPHGGLTHRVIWYSHLYEKCRCGTAPAPHRKPHRAASLLEEYSDILLYTS